MSEKDLNKIREIINGEDWPGDIWFIETIEELLKEVERLRHVENHPAHRN